MTPSESKSKREVQLEFWPLSFACCVIIISVVLCHHLLHLDYIDYIILVGELSFVFSMYLLVLSVRLPSLPYSHWLHLYCEKVLLSTVHNTFIVGPFL